MLNSLCGGDFEATTLNQTLTYSNRELTPAPGSRRGGVQLVRMVGLNAPGRCLRPGLHVGWECSDGLEREAGWDLARGDALTLAPRGPLGLEGLSSL